MAAPLSRALEGRSVRAAHDDLDALLVAVDPPLLDELLLALFGERPGAVQLELGGGGVLISGPLAEDCPECEGSPLTALLGALGLHAGSPIELLATLQVQLERQGGALALRGRRASLLLPRAPDR